MTSVVDWYDLGWLGHTLCSNCNELIGNDMSVKCIRIQTDRDNIYLHEGDCWNIFVVGIALFNDELVDAENRKVN